HSILLVSCQLSVVSCQLSIASRNGQRTTDNLQFKRRHCFNHRSDVDLAVWGLDERKYYRAVAQLLSVDTEISVDLVRTEEARKSLRARIEREGVII
ncbi:hypothetical protein QUF72_23605, partial [Desulfobacterales bacterium HSG2]|nr:hypothetical protein [Desulfobacterales bacterium HSG2]